MSLHKLTAGAGYDYLTRQIAAMDSTGKGHTGLASYYTARGESPGMWIGSGMDGIDGLAVGDPVAAEQMRAVFGCGLHPLAGLRQQQLEGPDLTERDLQEVTQLGCRSRSLMVSLARSGSRWPNASRRSRRQPACRWALRCRLLIGRGCGPRWPVSFPDRAWPGADGCPRAGGADRERLPAADPDGCGFGLPRVFRTVELCYFMLRAARLGIRCGPRGGVR